MSNTRPSPQPSPESASDLARQLGRDAMKEALGVGKTAISNAVVRGVFPPSWFVTLDGLARKRGIECPPHLFGMRQSVSGGANVG